MNTPLDLGELFTVAKLQECVNASAGKDDDAKPQVDDKGFPIGGNSGKFAIKLFEAIEAATSSNVNWRNYFNQERGLDLPTALGLCRVELLDAEKLQLRVFPYVGKEFRSAMVNRAGVLAIKAKVTYSETEVATEQWFPLFGWANRPGSIDQIPAELASNELFRACRLEASKSWLLAAMTLQFIIDGPNHSRSIYHVKVPTGKKNAMGYEIVKTYSYME